MPRRIALAYSGGLDTSAIIPWLKAPYGQDTEIIEFCGNVGQGDEELVGREDKAANSGAVDCRVAALRETFARDYVFPTLIGGPTYERRYLLGTSMARPILAKAHVEYAREVGADSLCHGCTGKGNDQVRFETTFAALAPDLEVIAPWRTWSMRSREELLQYLADRNIATTASATKIYSRDANLWHISHEGGAIEDPWAEPPADAWMTTTDPREAPSEHDDVTLTFERGRPVAVNHAPMAPHDLIEHLNAVAGPHGVGRVDIVENRVVGMKSRGLYETPGGTVIVEALLALEELCLDRDTMRLRETLALRFADLVYEGKWFCPVREAISAAAESIATKLEGDVVVRLYKGSATAIQRKSPHSLYAEDYSTFGEDEVYDQSHAEGFIRLFSLPSRIAAHNAAAAAQKANS